MQPILSIVHDDADVRAPLEQGLRERFGAQYDVVSYGDSAAALAALGSHAEDGRSVAVVLSADTPECGGAQFRLAVRDLHPQAQRMLIVGRGEWQNAHPAVEAMRTGQAESHLFVPWGPRERWLYLPVAEALADWEASLPPAEEVAQIVGDEWDPRTHELRDLFARIGIPHGFHPAEPEAAGHPVVTFPRSGTVLGDPSYARIAQALGFATEPDSPSCDLAIVGGGPAGLAAAVYGASEGRSTIIVARRPPSATRRRSPRPSGRP